MEQADYDKDGIGDECDSCPYTVDDPSALDEDGDDVWNSCDNCMGRLCFHCLL